VAVNGRSYIVVAIVATPVSVDLSQFVTRVYLRRGPFTTFFSTMNEGDREHETAKKRSFWCCGGAGNEESESFRGYSIECHARIW